MIVRSIECLLAALIAQHGKQAKFGNLFIEERIVHRPSRWWLECIFDPVYAAIEGVGLFFAALVTLVLKDHS